LDEYDAVGSLNVYAGGGCIIVELCCLMTCDLAIACLAAILPSIAFNRAPSRLVRACNAFCIVIKFRALVFAANIFNKRVYALI
jgi:hypothetical protein